MARNNLNLNMFQILSVNKKAKFETPRVSTSSENRKNTNDSKNRFSDRFIPTSISKNLVDEFTSKQISNTNNININSNNSSSNSSQVNNNIIKIPSVRKSDINYQKILQSEILEESTPKFDENIGTKNVLDLFKINRKLKYSTEVKKIRKIKINKENSVDNISFENFSRDFTPEKKIKIEKPLKSFMFENISDNFYLNTLDMYDYSKIALGNISGLNVFDGNKNIDEFNFNRFSIDTSSEIYCTKFINSNQLIFTDSGFTMKIKDLNKDLEILKFDMIQRKFLTIDFYAQNENVLFLGSDNSYVDFYDLRQKNKVRNLYKHDNNNEVCKVKVSTHNNLLISGGNDNKIIIFDIRKEKIIQNFKHKAAVKALALNDIENYLISGGGTFDKTIKLWDLKKMNLVSEVATDSQITNVEFISNDMIVASNGYISNNLVLYKLNYEKELNTLQENPQNMNRVSTENIFNKKVIFEKHAKRILYMSKSKCNKYITSCSTDGNLKIWNINKFIKNNHFVEESFYCGIR